MVGMLRLKTQTVYNGGMSDSTRQADIVNARRKLAGEICALRRAITEQAAEASSETVSSGAGSKSATRRTLAEMREELREKTREWAALGRALAGMPPGGMIRHIVTTRSGS